MEPEGSLPGSQELTPTRTYTDPDVNSS